MTRYCFTCAGLLALFVPSYLLPGPAAPPHPHFENLLKLPLTFERNQGQTASQVKFLARGQGYTLFLTSGEAVLAWHKASPKSGVLRMKLLGANPASDVSGMDEMPGKSNYFIGNDATKWHTNVPMYAKVKYKGVYSGIDLVYYGNQRQLEYDFVVAPGADPRRIQLGVRGASRISRSDDGDLVLAMDEGEIRWHKPVVYQEKGGAKEEIDAHYVIKGKNRVGFEVANYDLRRPLFIDPLVYSTYLGGSADDHGHGIAVDSSGNAYVTGYTTSTNFPTMNPLQPAHGGGQFDAFVAKLNPTGSALVYSTYLGGSGDDYGHAIAVDGSGQAYVAGEAGSTNFPTMNPLQPAYGGGYADAFVAKLNPTGSVLVYSTYLGGRGADSGFGIAVDSSGNAYISGSTYSPNFPTMNPLQPIYGGGTYDAIVAKLNPAGSALVYSTYLGGSADEYGNGIAADSTGNAYVTGYTGSTNFPTMNPLQPANGGGNDAFVAKLNPAGSALVYSTYLGGSGYDWGSGIAVDSFGNAYVNGFTASTNFPTMNPLQPTYGGGVHDVFVAKLNPTGSALVYSTYLGGNGDDECLAIAVDSSGNAYVTGNTSSTDFPTMSPVQRAYGGSGDAFVAELNPTGSALVYSTYLGGSGGDTGFGIAVDSSGDAYVSGYTSSIDFPTVNPLQSANGGGTYDAFVAKIAGGPPAVTFSPTSLTFKDQTIFSTSPAQNVTLTNTGLGDLTVQIGVTGPFAQTNTCGAKVYPAASCTISVTFKPAKAGTFTGSVSVDDNAPGSPQTLPLTGTGTYMQFRPAGWAFGTQPVGTHSLPKKVVLTNKGHVTVTITKVLIAGADAADFTQTNTCGTSLASGASCFITVTFTPTATGKRTAVIAVADNDGGSPQTAPLRGAGI